MKKKEEKPANHERWLLSYADFITLLMIFFIVLYSSSNIDASKYKQISESLGISLGGGGINIIPTGDDVQSTEPNSTSKVEEGTDPTTTNGTGELDKATTLTKVKQDIEQYMTENGLQNTVTTSINERGLVISLKDTVFFDSGKAQIRPESRGKLIEIGRIINKVDNYIRIEGHTDNVPIRNSDFASNWQLSAIRATNVTELMIGEAGIAPSKISAVGYGEYRAIADNGTADGRAKNRRVDIAIMDSKFNDSEQR